MRIDSYILSAKDILAQYDGKFPFAGWLKTYFSSNKKFGSKDRKTVAHLCYCFFRLGRSFEHTPAEEKIRLGLFLTSHHTSPELQEANAEWNTHVGLTLREKLVYLDAETEIEHVFPFMRDISDEISAADFVSAHFEQPHLFIRMRPGKEEKVMNTLSEASIEFIRLLPNALALETASKISDLIEIDKDAVIQDLSSQQVLNLLKEYLPGNKRISVWDCCAASGGKSILLWDSFSKVDLTVSDIRSSILKNMHNRFRRAGIRNYGSFVADIAAPQFTPAKKYDAVICDAPCSGSGTWSRTPEQLSYFSPEKLEYYSNLQKWIVLNASKSINKGGLLLYITCSVYKAENEDLVTYIQKETSLQLKTMQYYKGYNNRADTLFAALFTL